MRGRGVHLLNLPATLPVGFPLASKTGPSQVTSKKLQSLVDDLDALLQVKLTF